MLNNRLPTAQAADEGTNAKKVAGSSKTTTAATLIALPPPPPLVHAVMTFHAMSEDERARVNVEEFLDAAVAKQGNCDARFDGKTAFQWAALYNLNALLGWFFPRVDWFSRRTPARADMIHALELSLSSNNRDENPYTDAKHHDEKHANSESRKSIRFLLAKLKHSFYSTTHTGSNACFSPNAPTAPLDYDNHHDVTHHLIRCALKHDQWFFLDYVLQQYQSEKNAAFQSWNFSSDREELLEIRDKFLYIELFFALAGKKKAKFLIANIEKYASNLYRIGIEQDKAVDYASVVASMIDKLKTAIVQAIMNDDRERLDFAVSAEWGQYGLSGDLSYAEKLSRAQEMLLLLTKSSGVDYIDLSHKRFPLLEAYAMRFGNMSIDVFSLQNGKEDFLTTKEFATLSRVFPIDLEHDHSGRGRIPAPSEDRVIRMFHLMKSWKNVATQMALVTRLSNEWFTILASSMGLNTWDSRLEFKGKVAPEVEAYLIQKFNVKEVRYILTSKSAKANFSKASWEMFLTRVRVDDAAQLRYKTEMDEAMRKVIADQKTATKLVEPVTVVAVHKPTP